MRETPSRPRCIPVFRALGAASALAGAAFALAGIGLLAGLIAAGGPATGAILLGLGALAGFAGAMLIGFAANLEILHDIRAQQTAPPAGNDAARR